MSDYPSRYTTATTTNRTTPITPSSTEFRRTETASGTNLTNNNATLYTVLGVAGLAALTMGAYYYYSQYCVKKSTCGCTCGDSCGCGDNCSCPKLASTTKKDCGCKGTGKNCTCGPNCQCSRQ